jgi:hypothetical protein
MLPVVDKFHIGRVGDAGDTDARCHKDTTTHSNQQRICTNVGQPVFLERRVVFLHGDKGRRGAGSLVAALACHGGTGYNEDTKRQHGCVSKFKGYR